MDTTGGTEQRNGRDGFNEGVFMANMTDKEFWEKCGFRWWDIAEAWCYGKDEVSRELPPIDLNNLFKYAVPKLVRWEMGSTSDGQVEVTVCKRGELYPIVNKDKDPAQALKKAIEEVFNDR